jgi:hypothetical protein
MSRQSLVACARALVVLSLASFGLAPLAARAQIYEETFADWSASDWDNGYCQVRWCSGAEVYSSVSCDTPNVLRESGSTDDDIIWVHFGNRGCTQAQITFGYGQWQGSPPNPNLADTKLRYAVSTSDTFSCTTSVATLGLNLNLTYASSPQCFPATHTVNLTSSARSVYWKFDKGTSTPFFFADDIEISLTGCTCGPGACLTTLDEDFGTSFQAQTVCTLFPESFETCAGSGPYISSGTACAGVADEVMTFGTGYPYSEATLRCLNLTGLAAASLEFNYTKADSTLGPYLYASLNGTTWTQIWSAPFNFAGGCQPACADLGAYVGQAQVWLKFSSGTSSASQAHGIDDLHLARGEACCVNPVGEAGPDHTICAGETVVLEGSASGGSGGTCPGDYSPQWTGPGIVSGGNTFTPTVNAVGTYTLTVECDICSDPDATAVLAGEVPTVNAGADAALPCVGGPLALSGSVSGCTTGSTVLWTTADGHIVSGADTLTPSVDAPGTYTLHGTCVPGCSATDDVIVAAVRRGDWDGSGVIDLADFAPWDGCLVDPGNGLPLPACACLDFDSDAEVSLDDFGAFQAVFGL